MTYDILLGLTLFALASSITPGPNNLMLMASGANFGFCRSVPHMLGVALGFTFMVLLVGLGLVQVFDAFPASYFLLKVVSLVYLLYLAWKIGSAGQAGDGKGVVSAYFAQADPIIAVPSLHNFPQDKFPDGYIYEVISNGKGSMGAYKHNLPVRDRWAIVSYLRALQASAK